MYGTTVGINLILFFFIFPYVATITGGVVSAEGFSTMEIKVKIPCPGHAPLISSELKTIEGVEGSDYSFPNNFVVYYDSALTSEQEILSLEVFEEYPAEVISEEITGNTIKEYTSQQASTGGSCSGGCGGTSSCGGTCGSPSCSLS